MSRSIAIIDTEYYQFPNKSPKFSLGAIIKMSLNHQTRCDDVCIIEGVRIHPFGQIWIYRLRYLVSLSRWYRVDNKVKPGDDFEASEKVLRSLNARDVTRLKRSYINLLNLQTKKEVLEEKD